MIVSCWISLQCIPPLRMYCIDTEALVFMFNGGSLYGFTIHPILTQSCFSSFEKQYQVFNGLDGLQVPLLVCTNHINNEKHVHHGFLAPRLYLCSTSLNKLLLRSQKSFIWVRCQNLPMYLPYHLVHEVHAYLVTNMLFPELICAWQLFFWIHRSSFFMPVKSIILTINAYLTFSWTLTNTTNFLVGKRFIH